jgi:hypothetical protein
MHTQTSPPSTALPALYSRRALPRWGWHAVLSDQMSTGSSGGSTSGGGTPSTSSGSNSSSGY